MDAHVGAAAPGAHPDRPDRGRRRGKRRSVRGSMRITLVAAGAARAAYALLKAYPPGGDQTWARTNHRGEPVTLLEGPAAAAGVVAAAAAAPGVPARARAAAVLAGAGAAAFGGYDDLAGSGDRRGFRGHLGALRHGELTTGAVKIGGIGATGLAAAAMLGGSPVDVVVNASLVAGSANLINLFDLRPGRAIKVTLAAAAVLGASSGACAAAPVGAAAAMLAEDLGERAMLGDAGANALGAALGMEAAARLPRGARVALLAGIAGLTAASEVVSFTKVIERTPPLRWLDMLGRRPPAPRPPAPRPPAPRPAAPRPAAHTEEPAQQDGTTPSGSRSASNGTTAAAAGNALRGGHPRAPEGMPGSSIGT
jgi:UDP-GlcNAc:undecaprenyl-phosphate/decaprenyl-phosphate GlcNAc-1-phosphate transferase